jgi:hypothetical protein
VQLSEEARAEKRFLFQQKKLIEMKTVESREAGSKDQTTGTAFACHSSKINVKMPSC